MMHTTTTRKPDEPIDYSKCLGCGGPTMHFEAKTPVGNPTDGAKCTNCGMKVYVNSKASQETFGRSVIQG